MGIRNEFTDAELWWTIPFAFGLGAFAGWGMFSQPPALPVLGLSDIAWGTVGEWVGGVGALAAAVVALWLARRAERTKRAKESVHGLILAHYLFQELSAAHYVLFRISAKHRAWPQEVLDPDYDLGALASDAEVLRLPCAREKFDSLHFLPANFARMLVITFRQLKECADAIQKLAEPGEIEDFRRRNRVFDLAKQNVGAVAALQRELVTLIHSAPDPSFSKQVPGHRGARAQSL